MVEARGIAEWMTEEMEDEIREMSSIIQRKFQAWRDVIVEELWNVKTMERQTKEKGKPTRERGGGEGREYAATGGKERNYSMVFDIRLTT